jgi:hypothetical protein
LWVSTHRDDCGKFFAFAATQMFSVISPLTIIDGAAWEISASRIE